MRKTLLTDAMWTAFCDATGVTDDDYDVIAFAQGSGFETKLVELVLAGKKRATVNLMRNYVGEDKLPVIGGYVVTVDGEGIPRCIWRSIELRVGRLDSVDDKFAWDEGEGDRTRDWWLDSHRRFYAAQAVKNDLEMHDGLETVFERFTVVWPPEVADASLVIRLPQD